MATTATVIRNFSAAARESESATARAFWAGKAAQTFANRHGAPVKRTRKVVKPA